MKKSVILLFLLCLVLALSACSTHSPASDVPSQSDNVETSDVSDSTQAEEVPEEEVLTPIYAAQLKEGSYLITVDSSSSMFRVIKCELIVANGAMNAVMTMSGDGYGMVYMEPEKRHRWIQRKTTFLSFWTKLVPKPLPFLSRHLIWNWTAQPGVFGRKSGMTAPSFSCLMNFLLMR